MRDPARGEELKPFLAHLEDLRSTLIRCAVVLAVGTGVAFPLTPRILALLKTPLKGITDSPDTFLRSIEVSGAFAATMDMALWTGLLISAPALVFFIGQFVLPALTSVERRLAAQAGLLGVGLFAFGVWLGYRFTLPFALGAMFMLHGWLGISAEWTVTSYVAFTTQILIAFGLSFELPLVILILGRLGIVSSAQLRSGRRFAILAAFVIGAVLTPPDVVSQTMMAGPLVLLYELCVWMTWFWEKKRSGPHAVQSSG